MGSDDKLTAHDRVISAAMRQGPGTCSPDCVDAETMIGLIEDAGTHPNAGDLLTHIAGCEYCRHEYSEMRVLLETAIAATSAQSAAVTAPIPRRAEVACRRGIFRFYPAAWIGVGAAAILLIAVGLRGRTGSHVPQIRTTELPTYVRVAMNTRDIEFQVPMPHSEQAVRSSSNNRSPEPIYPVDECTASDRPLLQWVPVFGASGQKVFVFDSEETQEAVSPVLKVVGEWSPPALKAGSEHIWYVVATSNGRDVYSSQRRFRVLSKAELQRMESDLHAAGNDKLARGIVHASFGLLALAADDLQASKDPRASSLLNRIRTVAPSLR